MKVRSTVFLASASHGWLVEVAHGEISERVQELSQHYRVPLNVGSPQRANPTESNQIGEKPEIRLTVE
jgi:hypothetical protein